MKFVAKLLLILAVVIALICLFEVPGTMVKLISILVILVGLKAGCSNTEMEEEAPTKTGAQIFYDDREQRDMNDNRSNHYYENFDIQDNSFTFGKGFGSKQAPAKPKKKKKDSF